MKRKVGTILFACAIGAFAFVGCSDSEIIATSRVDAVDTSTSKGVGLIVADDIMRIDKNSYGREQVRTEQNQNHLNQVQPATKLDWSLERENLNKRLERWNDPNKVSYIYLTTDFGQIMAYYTIKGKVSSVNSKLTTTNQLIYNDYSFEDNVNGVVESPDMDGSYGSNGDAIFFFTTDDVYVEWNGPYLLCDEPLKLSTQPVMIEGEE